ncbi:MAG: dihydrolipoyl dehydrogenase [Anaerolineae bacterium]|nr:dihydrolipoyl dehydrogenase [Anaerolineae bacterium]
MASPYDLAIIGAGPGGYVAAIRAAQRGARVALIEKDKLGGTCLNRGCIPTKAMVQDAEMFAAASSGIYCIEADTPLRVNFPRMMARKREAVAGLVGGIEHLLETYQVDRISGHGRIMRPGHVQIDGPDGLATIEATAIIVATGSVPARPRIPGLKLPGVLTSDELLEIERLPESLVVIGASVVGIEFACIFDALGTKVSVLGRQTFLKGAEPQLAKRFQAMLSRRGVSVTIGLDFDRIERTPEGQLRVHYSRRGQAAFAEGELVLVSTGRRPFAEGLGLEDLGVRMHGPAIAVNEVLETSVPGIYAIGDCIGGYLLAHVASYEAEVAVDNILGVRRQADYAVVPNCIFTMPEIAGVGLTEAEAKEKGLDYRATRFPFSVNGRAVAMGESEGQVRLICERTAAGKAGRVLGVHIMGPRASDLIAEAGLAMRLGATAEEIAQTIHAHPTVPEALMEAAMAQTVGAIHYQNR